MITNCYFSANEALQGGGGAIAVVDGGYPQIQNCQFSGNAAWHGGAITASAPEYMLEATVSGCSFSANAATVQGGSGGAISTAYAAHVSVTECSFDLNVAGSGGVFACSGYSGLDVDHCIMTRNSATIQGGVLYSSDFTYPTITSCTMWHNACTGSSVPAIIHARDFGTPLLDHTIVSFSTAGQAGSCSGTYAGIACFCTDIYGNPRGDWVGCLDGQQEYDGNLHEDPLFCLTAAIALVISGNSPCAPAHNPECGLIGARGVGCNQRQPLAPPEIAAGPQVRVFPNPSREGATITYRNPLGGSVAVQICDVAGRIIRDLAPAVLVAGEATARWDGKDASGTKVASGIYFCRVTSGTDRVTRSVIVTR
jgi:hypothetical protein